LRGIRFFADTHADGGAAPIAAARLTITGRLKLTHNSQLLPGNKSPCYSTKLQILGRQTILMDRPAGSGTIFAIE
jgi:hypothetical protein